MYNNTFKYSVDLIMRKVSQLKFFILKWILKLIICSYSDIFVQTTLGYILFQLAAINIVTCRTRRLQLDTDGRPITARLWAITGSWKGWEVATNNRGQNGLAGNNRQRGDG